MTDMKFPYLTTRASSRNWYYRRVVPLELRPSFEGKREVWRSLGTPDKQEAIVRYHEVALEIDGLFADALAGKPSRTIFDDLRRKRHTAYRKASKDIWKYANDHDFLQILDPELHTEEDIVAWVENGHAKRRIEELKKQVSVGAVDARNAQEEVEALRHLIAGTVPESEPVSSPSSVPLVEDAKTAFLQEIKPNLTGTTWVRKRRCIGVFIKICGNRQSDNFTLSDGRKFLAHLQQQDRTANTINQYLRDVNQLFQWLASRYDENIASPVKSMRLSEKTPSTKERKYKPFNAEKLNKLKQITADHAAYWVLWVALYSGMRPGELVQLRVKDIKERDGVLFFDIHPHEDNKLKTPLSEREIPISERLLSLGFMDYVKALDDERIFPKWVKGARFRGEKKDDAWRISLSNFFTKMLVKIEVKEQGIVLRSCRHNFVDACRDAGMSHSVALWLQGRVEAGSAGGYGQGPSLAVKKAAIDQIEY
jgi:integrase